MPSQFDVGDPAAGHAHFDPTQAVFYGPNGVDVLLRIDLTSGSGVVDALNIHADQFVGPYRTDTAGRRVEVGTLFGGHDIALQSGSVREVAPTTWDWLPALDSAADVTAYERRSAARLAGEVAIEQLLSGSQDGTKLASWLWAAFSGITTVSYQLSPLGHLFSGPVSTDAAFTLGSGTDINGAWHAFTPVWASTANPQPVLGNGTFRCRYTQIGKTVIYQFNQTMGTTTTYGTNNWQWSLPVVGHASSFDLGYVPLQKATNTPGIQGGRVQYAANRGLMNIASPTNGAIWDSATPAGGWVSGDSIRGILTYEAA